MTDRSFQQANDRSRERLARLAAGLTRDLLRVDLGEGWTVASALAHVGFWDRWQAGRWAQMLDGSWRADSASFIAAEHIANEALDPYWAGIDADGVPGLAVEAAARLDELIAAAPDATVEALEGTPSAFLLHRHRHRDEHVDHIERSLAAAGRPIGAIAGGPTDRPFEDRNAASRGRLVSVVGRLTRQDLARPTSASEEGSWTIGQTLAHLAFWDRFLASRWRAALAAGPGAEPSFLPGELPDLLNSALEPMMAELAGSPGGGLLDEVVAAAEAVDALISRLPAETPIARLLADRPSCLDRSVHRAVHLDAIERGLGR